MKGKFFLMAAVLSGSQLLAQEDSVNTTLDEVVVTAAKYPKKQKETGKVITVINRQMLDQMGSRTVGEILNTAPGVTINGANASLGTNLGASIRGSSFGNVLILLDGIPVNDPSVISNYFDLNFINPAQIERIEILKGGQSTLYGSDAVAGVINIISKKAGGKPVNVQGSVMGGSYNTLQTALSVDGRIKNWHYSIGHQYTGTRGFSAANDSTGSQHFDKDGFQQQGLNALLGYRFSNRLALQVNGRLNNYTADADAAAFQDEKDFTIDNKNRQAGASFSWEQTHGRLQVNYQYNRVQRQYLNDSLFRSNPDFYFMDDQYEGITHFAEAYQRISKGPWEWLVGADFRHHNSDQHAQFVYRDFFTGQPVSGESGLPDSVAKSWQLSPYTSLVYNKATWNIEVGGRFNHHNLYGDHFTYTINPAWQWHKKMRMFANLSSAYKTPTHYQLFDSYAGNAALQPETSITFEGGMDGNVNEYLQWRGVYFNRRIKDVILYVITDPATFASQYRNVNRQDHQGMELELFFRKEKWNFTANYTYTSGRIRTAYAESGMGLGEEKEYDNLYRVPPHTAKLIAGFDLSEKLSFHSLLTYAGHRYEPVYMADPLKLDPYFTADLSATYKAGAHWQFFADFKNITNKEYFDIAGYNNRRFNMQAGLRFRY